MKNIELRIELPKTFLIETLDPLTRTRFCRISAKILTFTHINYLNDLLN